MGDCNDTLVSIVVPVYNSEKYLNECMQSLLIQTYHNIEIIVINDGSTDGSGVIIADYCKKDCRVICIDKRNEGVSAARNAGISRARGTYVMFVDADDWLAGNCIEQAVVYLEKHNLDMVLGGTVKVYRNRRETCVANTSKDILIYEDGMTECTKRILSNGKVGNSPLNSCFTSGPVCKLFKKDVIGTTRFHNDLVIGEDTVFNLDILKKVHRIGVIPEIWYYYRMHEESVTKKYNPQIQDYTEKLIELLVQRFDAETELRPYLCERSIQQFYGMLLLGALNERAGLSFQKKVSYIRCVLDKDLWKKVLGLCSVEDLPSGKWDKILLQLCNKKLYYLVILYIELRNRIKYVVNRRK